MRAQHAGMLHARQLNTYVHVTNQYTVLFCADLIFEAGNKFLELFPHLSRHAQVYSRAYVLCTKRASMCQMHILTLEIKLATSKTYEKTYHL